MNLILASQSPRRRTLLKQFGLDFSVQTLPVTEEESGEPYQVATTNALAKALPVSLQNPSSLVIGADTIVTLDEHILGKPHDAEDAEAMLHFLSGRQHEVSTIVALVLDGKTKTFSETTSVEFRKLTISEIKGYLRTGEPFDKAGGYGIQGYGGLLVKGIKGCYYNVVGLPMPSLVQQLRPFGIEVFT